MLSITKKLTSNHDIFFLMLMVAEGWIVNRLKMESEKGFRMIRIYP
jgi:hypothetical protein